MSEPYPGAAGRPEGPSLPRGLTNEMLRTDALEVARALDVYSLHPNTDREYERHAVSSAHALAAMEHAAFPHFDSTPDYSQERLYADKERAAKAAEERAAIEHRPGDPRYVLLNHLPSVIAASYGEGEDPDAGRYAVLKIQPEPAEPELEDERLTAEMRQRLFMQYQRELVDPIEIVWESNDPVTVHVLRGTESVRISELPIDQMIRTVHFLRRLAVWDALTRANDPNQPERVRQVALTLLEKLTPIVDQGYNEGREGQRGRP
ncbi:MAG TPA: hypothetical protein VL737_03460 [Candidatus Pristimantibacillus sp.]|nr:hypothetical protein [Candidatus Pristimantibacillus sp.]